METGYEYNSNELEELLREIQSDGINSLENEVSSNSYFEEGTAKESNDFNARDASERRSSCCESNNNNNVNAGIINPCEWYRRGLSEGMQIGFKKGYQCGLNRGIQQGRKEGFRAGYEKGVSRAEELARASFQRGLKEGYQKGFNCGYQKGFRDGVRVGYQRGFSDGYQRALRDLQRCLDNLNSRGNNNHCGNSTGCCRR